MLNFKSTIKILHKKTIKEKLSKTNSPFKIYIKNMFHHSYQKVKKFKLHNSKKNNYTRSSWRVVNCLFSYTFPTIITSPITFICFA